MVKLQQRRVKFWCRCTGETSWAENVPKNGSNALAKGRKRLTMSHVRVGHWQAEPLKSSRKCGKWWHVIGDWRWDSLRRNWALARTRRTPSSAMIWVSGRSAPDLCLSNSRTSRRQNGWKLLETSFPCVTVIFALRLAAANLSNCCKMQNDTLI